MMNDPQCPKIPDFARSAPFETGPETKVHMEFPIELARVDYLRRLYFNVGAAILCIHQHIQAITRKKKSHTVNRAEAGEVEDDIGDTDILETTSDQDQVDYDLQQDSPSISEATKGLKISALKYVLDSICNNPEDDLRSFEQSYGLAIDTDDSINGKKKSAKSRRKTKKAAQKIRSLKKRVESYTYLLAAWSAALNRDANWITKQCRHLQDLAILISDAEFGLVGGSGRQGMLSFQSPIKLTDSQVKSEFEYGIELLVVVSELFENTLWNLRNIQRLRTQFVKQISYRRERLKAERKAARIARGGNQEDDGAEGGGPGTNDDGSLQFDYRYDFDRNGILWHLGKLDSDSHGSLQEDDNFTEDEEDDSKLWQNPALANTVKAFRSSKGAGTASDICGRNNKYSCTDYREPRQFMGVDLGPYFRVYPSCYTLRHGSSQGILALRDWNIEGSQDGKKWFPLRKHRADEELPRTAYSTHTWKIEKSMQRKCRMIRIIQTRPVDMTERLLSVNDGGITTKLPDAGGQHHQHPTHHALFLCGLELYGKLVEV